MKYFARRFWIAVATAAVLPAGFNAQAEPAGKANKVIIYPTAQESIEQLRKQGIRKVDDYGSYWVATATDEQVDALKQTHGDRAVKANYLNRIELNAAPIDTTVGERAIPSHLQQAEAAGKRLRLIQFKGPVQPEWLEQVKAAGDVKVVSYVPNNAYVLYLDSSAEAKLNALKDPKGPIQWIGKYHPYYKMRPSLQNATTPTVEVRVAVVNGPQADRTIEILHAYSLTVPGEITTALDQAITQITVMTGYLPELAALPGVLWIEQVFPTKKMDEQQNFFLTLSEAGPTNSSYISFLTAVGFSTDPLTYPVVDVADTGLDEENPNCNTTECRPTQFIPFITTFHPSFYTFPITLDDVSSCFVNQGRVMYRDNDDTDGHGTAVASVLGGYDTLPDETVNCITESNTSFGVTNIVGGVTNITTITCLPTTNAASPPFPANVLRRAGGLQLGLGVSPFGRIGSSAGDLPGVTFIGDFPHAQSIYLRTARISNNSWGEPLTDQQGSNSPPSNAGVYNSRSQAYDFLTRDSLITGSTNPATSHVNQELIYVFAGGNVSDVNQPGGVGGFGDVTVTPPATAKNVISVGATTKSDPPQISPRSAFGPTEDGRFKPDIMAPGVDIWGAISQASYDHEQCGGCNPNAPNPAACADDFALRDIITRLYGPPGAISLHSGTSFAAPAVAGGVQLLWWYFQNHFFMLQPSPAMAKAYLLNSARYIPIINPLTGTGDRLPSIGQGMGQMDLTRMFDGVPRILRDQSPARAIDSPLLATNAVVQQTYFSRSGQSYELTGAVISNGSPFRVTLAWTDAPGDPSAFKQLVNDLDLDVTVGGQTYKGNVFQSQFSTIDPSRGADSVNNVESAFFPAGTTGTWSIIVRAANIAGNGVPGIANRIIGQDFALVVYNATGPSDAPNFGTNDTCQTAQIISNSPYSVILSNFPGTAFHNTHPSPSAGLGGAEGFWKMTRPTAGTVVNVDTFGSSFNTLLSVWKGTCGSLAEEVSNNNASNTLQSAVIFTTDGTNDYYIVAEGLNNAGGTLHLNVKSSPAPVQFVPPSLDFGNVFVGATGAVFSAVLANGTVQPLTINTIVLTGDDPGDFLLVEEDCAGSVVPAGGDCTVRFQFAPTVTGSRSAQLVANDNAIGSPHTLQLSGTGLAPVPAVCQSAISLGFGTIATGGSSSPRSVTFTNCGSAALSISSLGITGSGDFAIVSNTCTGAVLQPGEFCTVSIVYSPTVDGSSSATLSIVDNADTSPQHVTLSGVGSPQAPAVCLSASAIDFGDVLAGGASSIRSVVVTNCGTAALVISTNTLSGTGASRFSITSNGCIGNSLLPGATCTINLQFFPTTVGAVTATLNIVDNATGSPQHVTLTGNGSGNQPDALISRSRRLSKFIGDNVYNNDGSQQTISVNAKRGKRRVFYVRIQNDGNATDTFNVQGTGDIVQGTSVRYFLGAMRREALDITDAVKAGTFTTTTLSPGSTTGDATLIRVEVTVDKLAFSGFYETTVTLISTTNPSRSDTVKATVVVQ